MKYFFFLLTICLLLHVSAQIPHVTSGSIRRFEKFHSQYVQPRNIDVWLPENYNPNQKYAVLYMHDGQMLFDTAITWNHQAWKVDETVTKLLKQGRIKDCIVVGIWNNGDNRHAEYFPQKALAYLPDGFKEEVVNDDLKRKPLADNYLLFITTELKPFIDSTFSTKTDSANTFIAGSSMGGLISLYAICEYPHVFGGAICMSTHWVGSTNHQNYRAFSHAFCAYLAGHLPDGMSHKIYFDHGDKTLDSLYWPYQMAIDKVMEASGYNFNNWMGDDHSENSWGPRLGGPLKFMLGVK